MSKQDAVLPVSTRTRPPRWPLALVAFALASSIAPEASAIEDELTIGLGPGYSDLRIGGGDGQLGFGAGLYAEYRLTDFWGLTAGAYGSYQLSDSERELPGVTVGSGWLGVLYNIDITTYVPFISLSATAYRGEPDLVDAEGEEVFGGIKLGLGVDYRRYRHFSFGVEGNLHAFLTDVANYPVYVTTLIRFNYHYEL